MLHSVSKTADEHQEQTKHTPSKSVPEGLGVATKTTVLIVSSQQTSRRVLEELLTSLDPTLSLQILEDPNQVIEQLNAIKPDLVITSYRLPNLNGIDFIKLVRSQPVCMDVPVIMVTNCDEREIRYRALDAGAADYMVQPIDHYEFQSRCRNLLAARKQQRFTKIRLNWLEQRLSSSSEQIRVLEEEALMRLARAGEYRDEITGTHVLRMAKFTRFIAEGLSLSPSACEEVERAAPMHDIGKIGIPDEVLLKPGKLNVDERKIMKDHVQIGYEILKGSSSQYLRLGAVAALNHHERFDGLGYPNGLQGKEIPLIARIVAVADVFDALTSERPYKESWSFDQAIDYLEENSGSHFDPECVQAFVANKDRVSHVQQTFR